MSLHVGNTSISEISYGSLPISEVWYGNQLVWQNGIKITYHDNIPITLTYDSNYIQDDTQYTIAMYFICGIYGIDASTASGYIGMSTAGNNYGGIKHASNSSTQITCAVYGTTSTSKKIIRESDNVECFSVPLIVGANVSTYSYPTELYSACILNANHQFVGWKECSDDWIDSSKYCNQYTFPYLETYSSITTTPTTAQMQNILIPCSHFRYVDNPISRYTGRQNNAIVFVAQWNPIN